MKFLNYILKFFFGYSNVTRGFIIHFVIVLLYCVLCFAAWRFIELNSLDLDYTIYYQLYVYWVFVGFIIMHLLLISVFRWSYFALGIKAHVLTFSFYFLGFILTWWFLEFEIPRHDYKIYYQLKLSRLLVLIISAHLGLILIAARKKIRKFMINFFLENASPYNLAIFRIFFFSILSAHFIFYVPGAKISWTVLSDSSRVNLPFMGWLVQNIAVNPSLYKVAAYSAGILCFFVSLGFFTRFSLFLSLPFIFYVLGVPMFFGKINHDHILLWVSVIFCFAPSSDVWSIDTYIKSRRQREFAMVIPHPRYGLPFKFIWIQLAIIYFFSGIFKLWDSGLNWALGPNMINQMRLEWVEHYDKVPAIRLDNYPAIAKLGGIFVIYFELLYFVLILKPKFRIWAFISAFSFHKLCGYFMYIDFISLRHIATSYLNWDKLIALFKIGQKGKTSVLVTNDGQGRLINFIRSNKLRTGFIVCVTLLFINFIFSAFNIHSFPFSSYPTYSSSVKDEVELIKMNVLNKSGLNIDLKACGKKNEFRWENIRPYEMRIAETFKRGDTSELSFKLNEYWSLWKNNVNGLGGVSRVSFYLETTKIKPEDRHTILKSVYLGSLKF